ncbi:hypothetical protein [Phenylobacterium sp.]|uniref:hypothetical protein n=1 Tax=Phenylobacterium sp. TaxID=1871053 RepID=UPI00120BFE87|nr:hypothetical protein [Phenylobacterium sp.]THD71074.1 MAG: hypothetical protein E8A12_02175 [Phenylobacterium sp.]
MPSQTERSDEFDRPTSHGRSFAKDIAELALFLELTEPAGSIGHLDAATAEVTSDRRVPLTTLKRCISEARALIEFAHESGALRHLQARAAGAEWALRSELAVWLDETRLTEVLKQRALRLNRSRGGRPSTTTRTLRAVEELVAFARAGRPDALDELRSIQALVAEA